MTKRNHQVTLAKNEKGQISIFFSASLVVIVSLVAFVINIGLFVKAKINLQNATDSAAYAGAAVQSRQLTKIAYLNWEMRNIYKEWLYKYYVVGNLNNLDVQSPSGTGPMQFNMEKDNDILSNLQTEDQFNIPIVCIHPANSETNICRRYSIPGIPEFGSSNIIGAEQASRALIDSIIATKVANCIDRTRLNMLVANTWTYNVMSSSAGDSLSGQGPAILTDRQGAWPRAVELAIRIRNLEYVMNRPAVEEGICNSIGSGQGKTRCTKDIQSVISENKLGNERIVKAFYSAYRNLGNDTDNEMKESFTLSEIPPQVVTRTNKADASNLLSHEKAYTKQWVDLKLMMVNYSIFYAAMIPRATNSGAVPVSGACDVSKVALPVPGYPMGFYKDPNVLTYYAVKGEAVFLGMFNPFQTDGIKMQAYSAAKPFGGRIGPALFIQKPGTVYLASRKENNKYRSVPYITSYDFNGTTIRNQTIDGNNFVSGTPLPTNSSQPPGAYWLEDSSSALGGITTDSKGVQFGVPNLVYDYETPYKTDGYTIEGQDIHKIKSSTPSPSDTVGLFSRSQFAKFKGTQLSAMVTPQTLVEEINRVRAPTLYEAANYLIPSPTEFNKKMGMDNFGFAQGTGQDISNNEYKIYNSQVYAPLVGGSGNGQQDILFNNVSEVTNAIFDFMRTQETGIKKYKMSMNRAALAIYAQRNNLAAGAQGSAIGFQTAAEGVSDINLNGSIDQTPATCKSLAGQFLYFYFGGEVNGAEKPADATNCPKPLGDLIKEYFSNTNNFNPTYYNFDLVWKNTDVEGDGQRLMTAYMPGPATGVNMDGMSINPMDTSIRENMRRNQYSTKLIPIDSLRRGGAAQWDNSSFPIYSEGNLTDSASSQDAGQKEFANPLMPERIGADDIGTIEY